jgi:hypothetical protein
VKAVTDNGADPKYIDYFCHRENCQNAEHLVAECLSEEKARVRFDPSFCLNNFKNNALDCSQFLKNSHHFLHT